MSVKNPLLHTLSRPRSRPRPRANDYDPKPAYNQKMLEFEERKKAQDFYANFLEKVRREKYQKNYDARPAYEKHLKRLKTNTLAFFTHGYYTLGIEDTKIKWGDSYHEPLINDVYLITTSEIGTSLYMTMYEKELINNQIEEFSNVRTLLETEPTATNEVDSLDKLLSSIKSIYLVRLNKDIEENKKNYDFALRMLTGYNDYTIVEAGDIASSHLLKVDYNKRIYELKYELIKLKQGNIGIQRLMDEMLTLEGYVKNIEEYETKKINSIKGRNGIVDLDECYKYITLKTESKRNLTKMTSDLLLINDYFKIVFYPKGSVIGKRFINSSDGIHVDPLSSQINIYKRRKENIIYRLFNKGPIKVINGTFESIINVVSKTYNTPMIVFDFTCSNINGNIPFDKFDSEQILKKIKGNHLLKQPGITMARAARASMARAARASRTRASMLSRALIRETEASGESISFASAPNKPTPKMYSKKTHYKRSPQSI